MMGELGAGPPAPGHLREVLARTLRDPSVEVACWLPGREHFVDGGGDPVVVPRQGRMVTYLERDGARIAALVHDRALAEEPELVDAVAAGAGMALENDRLHAEIRAQLREVQASRARIVASADAARRRVERDLHDGAQQRLVRVALAVTLARRRLGSAPVEEVATLLKETGEELAGALDELRELARGIYPVLLTDAGLRSGADGSGRPLPDSGGRRRDAPRAPARAGRAGRLLRAGYFVVSEARTNATKHSCAARVEIDVRIADGSLVVEIADDGVGGADPRGSGPRGLADRVAAVGGRLHLSSPPGGGTRLRAEVPCP